MQKKEIDCTCKRTKCERYKDCVACKEHHSRRKLPPACEREKNKSDGKSKEGKGAAHG